MRPTIWAVIGSVWTAWWLFILIWITWYDYPRTKDIYAGFLGDGTWFWHEIAIPIGIWLFGMACLMMTQLGFYAYQAARLLESLVKRIEKGG
jgi:hypothetical protein